MRRYEVYVTGKPGIFDPAGKTTAGALDNLGYSGVERVRIGKFLQLECDDAISLEQVTEMCEKLLANPIIEDYRIECTPENPSRADAQAVFRGVLENNGE
ncbi:MAG: phosphoribosylformylglycinamidine synthase subunit PurS [Candidatus Accumulibacter sp.]|jgi:phosphoribosylformylglycinamidine synthase|nr:phosphoribosylformylglycinamidine synthase subunit PurS [Accumulibacter sp.]